MATTNIADFQQAHVDRLQQDVLDELEARGRTPRWGTLLTTLINTRNTLDARREQERYHATSRGGWDG